MTIRIAITGFGRIGRNVLRALHESGRTNEFAIVAINDLGDAETNAHLARYDTVHGRFRGDIRVGGDMVATMAKFCVGDKISYISTGGGAFLEFLESRTLPAVEVLEKRAEASIG